MITTHTTKDIKDFLMDPKTSGLKEAYFIIRGEDQDIIVVESGKNSQEFNKTAIYFHQDNGVSIFHCLFGQGILLMQRNDEAGEVKEFKVVALSPGKQVVIPAGFAYSLVNVSKGFMVGLDNVVEILKGKDLDLMKQRVGLAYYVVEKKGEISFEQNPNYFVHPQISTE